MKIGFPGKRISWQFRFVFRYGNILKNNVGTVINIVNYMSNWHTVTDESKNQAGILAPDIGQYPVKNRVKSDESCFTKDTVVRQVTNLLKITSIW